MPIFLLGRPMGDLVETNIYTVINSNKSWWWRWGGARSWWPTPSLAGPISTKPWATKPWKLWSLSTFNPVISLCLTVMLVKKPCVDHHNRQEMPEKHHIPATGPDGKFTAARCASSMSTPPMEALCSLMMFSWSMLVYSFLDLSQRRAFAKGSGPAYVDINVLQWTFSVAFPVLKRDRPYSLKRYRYLIY